MTEENEVSVGGKLITVSEQSVTAMQRNVEQLGNYIIQMGRMMGTLQRKMEEMEERQKKVTISHRDVKNINALIRFRSGELCRNYNLTHDNSKKAIRAAMRKAVLQKYQVKDFHDLPEIALGGVQMMLDRYANIRLVMDLKAREQPDASAG